MIKEILNWLWIYLTKTDLWIIILTFYFLAFFIIKSIDYIMKDKF